MVIFHEEMFGERQYETLKGIFDFLDLQGNEIKSKVENKVNVTNPTTIDSDKRKVLTPYFSEEYKLCSVLLKDKLPSSWDC